MIITLIILGLLGIIFVIGLIKIFIKESSSDVREEIESLNEELTAIKCESTDELIILRVENSKLKHSLIETETSLENLRNELILEIEKNRTLLSQKKSSETKLGQTSEQLTPFLSGFKYDPKMAHFIGAPIDYVIFDIDSADPSVVFLEVKTNNSRLNTRQKTIKNLIKLGKVRFEEYRISEKGQKTRLIKNEEEEK